MSIKTSKLMRTVWTAVAVLAALFAILAAGCTSATKYERRINEQPGSMSAPGIAIVAPPHTVT